VNRQRFEYALKLKQSGRLEEALREFHAVAESASDLKDKVIVLLNEVSCASILRRFDYARELLRQVANILPEDSQLEIELRLHEASILIDEGKYSDALQALDALLPDCMQLRNTEYSYIYEGLQVRRGYMLVHLGRYKEAYEQLREAVTFDLQEADKELVTFYLGLCSYELNELETAKRYFKYVISSNLDADLVVRSHYYNGLALYRTGAMAWAKQEFEACEAKVAGSSIPKAALYEMLAATSESLGQDREAARYKYLARQSSDNL
jgi:tetratricopeptide (TPR) repeat protein